MTDFESRLATLPGSLVALARDAFGDHLTAVVVHGSAHRGRDFVPFWSDFDCHLYLDAELFAERDQDRLNRILAFRRGHSRLTPEEYGVGYIQVISLYAASYPRDWAAPIDGTYVLAYGSRPEVWDAPDRPDAVTASAATLSNLRPLIRAVTSETSDIHRTALARVVRGLATLVKPALYSAATLISNDAPSTWTADLNAVLSTVEEQVAMPSARAFYARVREWTRMREDTDELEVMMRDAVRTLVSLSDWHQSR